jgi:hypothetical protein
LDVTFLAGITGFDKSAFVKKFAKMCLRKNGYSDDLESHEARRFIQYVKFEDELLREDETSTDIPGFLEKLSFREKCDTIERTFKRIAKQVDPNTSHLFLDIHLSYYKRSGFIPPMSVANFRELVPRDETPVKIVTLIDDVFVIWKNLRAREHKFPGTKLRLREILSWRSLEMLQAEAVAMNYTNEQRNVENYLVAVRTPVATLYNLTLRPRPLRAYLSFPITKTRSEEESVENINHFRTEIHSLASKHNVALFDPVTIDELALKIALEKSKARNEELVSLQSEMRWPLDSDEKMVREPDWPIDVPKQEIEEVLPDINNNIRARDFKLIDNSRLTIAYRPYFGGESKGVRQEMEYTVQQGKHVYAYDPKEDSGNNNDPHPFDTNVVVNQNRQDFMKTLDELFSSGY